MISGCGVEGCARAHQPPEILDEACERAPNSEMIIGRGGFCPPALALKVPYIAIEHRHMEDLRVWTSRDRRMLSLQNRARHVNATGKGTV